jgi:malonyl-CoA/methylmalonyl-CoA synthetase
VRACRIGVARGAVQNRGQVREALAILMVASPDPAEWIDGGARSYPQRVFLRTSAGRQLSYATLHGESGRFAAAFAQRGVVPGDRVAVQVEKSLEAVLLYIACLRLGAVFVPINDANTPNEVDYFLRDSQPRVAVIRPGAPALAAIAERAGVGHVETLGVDGQGSLVDGAGATGGTFMSTAGLNSSSLASIIYTSGTTGRSKGAMLTRGNLASNAEALMRTWGFSSADVLLHALPLFHIHGLFAAINTVLAAGAGLLLLPRFDAEAVLRHLPEVTVFMGVPTHYTRLLQQRGLDRESTARMRLFVSGSAPLLAETHREFSERTGHAILERYGMTETLINTSNPYAGARVPGSVGKALPGVAIRITERVGSAIEEAEEAAGAVEVKGSNVFAGYWKDAQKTRAEFTPDGWFKTGDLGRLDSQGYLYIVGRAKDLVISGGYNVYPREVETELDALEGVVESAVFGVPHPDFGEGVTAVVVSARGARLSEEAIIQALQGRLARYKVPKRVLLIDELPRNAMGKVQKNVLRASYAGLYHGN